MLAAVIRTMAYTYPRCWCTHARSLNPDRRWRTLTQDVDEVRHTAVIWIVAFTYPRCWCTHARSRNPDCGVHLPKVLMHSCSQPWSGLWHSSYSFMKLAAWFNSVWYCKQFVYLKGDCSWSWIHERKIALRFLGIILRVLLRFLYGFLKP